MRSRAKFLHKFETAPRPEMPLKTKANRIAESLGDDRDRLNDPPVKVRMTLRPEDVFGMRGSAHATPSKEPRRGK
jgi:hypothetical protein